MSFPATRLLKALQTEGHAGAQLALRQGGAVGQVVSLLDRHKLGVVAAFEPATGTHRVTFFDGSKAARVQLWAERVRLVQSAEVSA